MAVFNVTAQASNDGIETPTSSGTTSGHVSSPLPDHRQPFEFHWFRDSEQFIQSFNDLEDECISPNGLPNEDIQTKLGRIAFNSPRLLGGQASRMGLSCASCHRSGRSNPHFFIKQISAKDGEVDITHSFFSSLGGDDVFNPKAIPDLAARNTSKFSDREHPEFSRFLKQLIEIEFDGRPTPKIIFNALQHYLQKLSLEHCNPDNMSEGPTELFEQHWLLLQDSLLLLNSTKDKDARYFLTQSARTMLEVLYQNFGLPPNSDVDKALIDFSRKIQYQGLREFNNEVYAGESVLLTQAPRLKQLLIRNLDKSAYSRQALKRFFAQSPNQ